MKQPFLSLKQLFKPSNSIKTLKRTTKTFESLLFILKIINHCFSNTYVFILRFEFDSIKDKNVTERLHQTDEQT